MHPIFIQIGNFIIRWYGVMIFIAVVLSLIIGLSEAKKRGLNMDYIYDFALFIIIGGIFFSRVSWVFTSADVIWYFKHPLQIFAFWEGGLSYFGAILGGIIAAIIVVKWRSLPFWTLADIVAPLIALSFGIGKIGCFLNGCCHGTLTSSFIGIIFIDPFSQCELLGEKLWPAQLMNSLEGFLIFLFLYFYLRKKQAYEGEIFVWYLYLYSVLTFFVEFTRYIPVHFLKLTPNQWTSIITIIVTFFIQRYLIKRKKKLESAAE